MGIPSLPERHAHAGRSTPIADTIYICPLNDFLYKGTNHGFHNDTTPRYDDAAAKLAWQRTVDFFNATLR